MKIILSLINKYLILDQFYVFRIFFRFILWSASLIFDAMKRLIGRRHFIKEPIYVVSYGFSGQRLWFKLIS